MTRITWVVGEFSLPSCIAFNWSERTASHIGTAKGPTSLGAAVGNLGQ